MYGLLINQKEEYPLLLENLQKQKTDFNHEKNMEKNSVSLFGVSCTPCQS